VESGKEIAVLKGHTNAVNSAAFSDSTRSNISRLLQRRNEARVHFEQLLAGPGFAFVSWQG
jgi:hypothetical protein